MSQTESITPTTSRPTSPESVAHTASVESGSMISEAGQSDHEIDGVFIATAENSSDEHTTESIESTSEADWSRVRTRAQTVISDSGSDDERETLTSLGEESFDMMSPGQSIGLQSVPSRTTGTSGSVLSLEDAQSSIDAFFTNRQNYTSKQSNKLLFWQALCVEFGLVDMSSNPLPSFSDLEIIAEDSEIASNASDSGRSSATSISIRLSQMNRATSSGPSASSKSKRKGKKSKNLPPLPTTLSAAKNLLATKAHVNLKDYVAARHEARGGARKDQALKGPAEDFAYLVHPSKRALINYTMDTEKYFKKSKAKDQWLQPMLEQMC